MTKKILCAAADHRFLGTSSLIISATNEPREMVLTCRALVLAFAIVLHAAFLPAADGKGKGKKKSGGSRSGGTMTSPAPHIRIGREGEYPIGGTWFFLGEPFPDLLEGGWIDACV
jgi:hypothetical protein